MRLLNALAVMLATTALSAQGQGSLEVGYQVNASLESPTADADGNVYFSNRGTLYKMRVDIPGTRR